MPGSFDGNKKVWTVETTWDDTLSMRVFFDTGTYGLIMADTLGVSRDTAIVHRLRIGKHEKEYFLFPKGNLVLMTTRNPIYSFLGIGAVAGWDFFDGKIVELSYKDHSIKLLDRIKHPKDYVRIPMKRQGNYWGIPVTIYMQGKKIEEYTMIDTGNTGLLTLNSDIAGKYGINLDEARKGMVSTSGNAPGESRHAVPADSLQIGGVSLGEFTLPVSFRGNGRRSPFAGLLGNPFWEKGQAILILDFKNGILYMKYNY